MGKAGSTAPALQLRCTDHTEHLDTVSAVQWLPAPQEASSSDAALAAAAAAVTGDAVAASAATPAAGRFTTSSTWLATGGTDEAVHIWRVSVAESKLTRAFSLEANHSLGIVGLAAGRTDAVPRTLLTSCMDGHVRSFNLDAEGACVGQLALGTSECWTLSAHPSRAIAATGTSRGVAHVFDYGSGGSMQRIAEYGADTSDGDAGATSASGFVTAVSFSPDGKLLALGTSKKAVIVLDVETKRTVKTLSDAVKAIRGLAWSPDSKQLLTGSEDSNIRAYDVRTGETTALLAGHSSWVLSLAWKADTRYFASSGADHKVALWDLRARDLVSSHESPGQQVWGCQFSGDGSLLASVADEANVKVFSVGDGI